MYVVVTGRCICVIVVYSYSGRCDTGSVGVNDPEDALNVQKSKHKSDRWWVSSAKY